MQNVSPPCWTRFAPDGWRMTALTDGAGRPWKMAVAMPAGTPPENGFASLFVLDGAQHFAAVAGAATALSRRPGKTGVPPLVVIGLFQGEGAHDPEARFRDYTDTPPPPEETLVPHRHYGGAEVLRDLLRDQALPAALDAAPLDPGRRTLFGHSLGGLFVLETLARRPGLFSRWAAVSPSLWWRPELRLERIDGPLLLGCGEAETGRDMLNRIRDWARDHSALGPVRLEVVGQADHGSAPFLMIPELLRHAGRS